MTYISFLFVALWIMLYEILQGQAKMDQLRLEAQPPAHYPLSLKAESIMENASKGLCDGIDFTSDKKLNKNLRKLLRLIYFIHLSQDCTKYLLCTMFNSCDLSYRNSLKNLSKFKNVDIGMRT